MHKLILTLAILTMVNIANAADSHGWCYQPVVVNNQIYYQQVQCQPVQQTQQHQQSLTFYGARTSVQGASSLVYDVSTGIQSVRNMISAFKGGF